MACDCGLVYLCVAEWPRIDLVSIIKKIYTVCYNIHTSLIASKKSSSSSWSNKSLSSKFKIASRSSPPTTSSFLLFAAAIFISMCASSRFNYSDYYRAQHESRHPLTPAKSPDHLFSIDYGLLNLMRALRSDLQPIKERNYDDCNESNL